MTDLRPGDVVPWKGARWVLVRCADGATTLRHPVTWKRRRLPWGSDAHAQLRRAVEDLWVTTRPHCYGQRAPCFWCTWGLGAADTARGGAVATMVWREDDP